LLLLPHAPKVRSPDRKTEPSKGSRRMFMKCPRNNGLTTEDVISQPPAVPVKAVRHSAARRGANACATPGDGRDGQCLRKRSWWSRPRPPPKCNCRPADKSVGPKRRWWSSRSRKRRSSERRSTVLKRTLARARSRRGRCHASSGACIHADFAVRLAGSVPSSAIGGRVTLALSSSDRHVAPEAQWLPPGPNRGLSALLK